ncbi:phospholipase D-like domain-containing protein [Paraburkholderia sp. J94]|uniref:phospholipase D-like domain-containing protein n=1 Tax=Paraburkholderia sp. J94 TaxID=2805441 RepID=UPI002AAFFC77|nr:phospholipase D-like domain-containing protein [Paraburkholderia sp. J94]
MPSRHTTTPKEIDRLIRSHLAALTKPGALFVRPGFEIAGDQLTGRQAIVVTVQTKLAVLPAKRRLPDSIERVPVDVREATALQRLRAQDPAAASLAAAYARPEDAAPDWPDERELPSGRLLTDKRSVLQKTFAKQLAAQPFVAHALAAHAKKRALPYVPAPGAPLEPLAITKATITAHVSPDAGLKTLEAFLAGTRKSLVVGMYDFTSAHILKAFESALAGKRTLQMVLDNPAPNPTRDQTDGQTVEQLNQTLGGRAKIAWALERQDVYAAAWIFPYAYHIKVMVRDGDTVWLSSGNLNNSNQPDLSAPPRTEDRDWHVIIENMPLAALFGAYLNQDYASAQAHQAASVGAEPERAIVNAHAKLAAQANPPVAASALVPFAATKPRYVSAKVFRNIDTTVTPLLTPDTLPGSPARGQYITQIRQLIESARTSLYIQLQYIESSNGKGDYDALLATIAARVAASVDVRLIESAEYGVKWAEKMKAAGVDLTANIRLQSNVHNKGFVVDSKIVVVSSQNFSPAGIEQNRDAGVMIESAQIAAWYEAVFVSDWNERAKPFVAAVKKKVRVRGGTRG